MGMLTSIAIDKTDIVKTRLQNQAPGEYRGLVHCFKSILAKEGGRGLYRGDFIVDLLFRAFC